MRSIGPHHHTIVKDAAIVFFSVILAFVLAKTHIVSDILMSSVELELVGSFIAGMFFTSVFTVAMSTVTLAQIAKANSIILVALFGSAGALLGDFIIFRFVKDRVAEDLMYLLGVVQRRRLASIFRLKLFRYLTPLIGALIIASPLPDELGIAMIGFSRIETPVFIPISLLFNFLGILLIGLIAQKI